VLLQTTAVGSSARTIQAEKGGQGLGTVSQFFQPPLYWQQFEELCTGLLGEVYGISDAQQYGRSGQAQNGVDSFGRSKRYGMIGIQCKRLSDLDKDGNPYPGGPIDRKFLRSAASESLAFKPDLKLWILATTARRDTAVQGWVNEINSEWNDQNRDCIARVWSWDECVSYLNAFPDLQQWYYADVIKVRGSEDIDALILETIAMAFDRPAFEVPLHCETPAEFLQALADTQKAVRTGELVDRETRHIIRKAIGGWRDLANADTRARIGEVSRKLRTLRASIEQGRKSNAIRDVHGFLDIGDPTLACELDSLRRQCVDELNHALRDAGLQTI
jgi:hypothetical protein